MGDGLFDDGVKNLFKCDAKSVSIHNFHVREERRRYARGQVEMVRAKFKLQID